MCVHLMFVVEMCVDLKFGCSWGPIVEKSTYKNKQRLYLSEQVLFLALMSVFLVYLLSFKLWTDSVLVNLEGSVCC